jgi:hypothetical protein
MKTSWAKKIYQGLLLLGLVGAGVGMVGCADEYAAYPGYRGGYYASYSAAPYPYYGGYSYPYRAYGPYYGGPSYGYGSPYYGRSTVVISGSRSYAYRDRFGRVHNRRNGNRVRRTSRTTQSRSTQLPGYQSDDERRYYTPR